MINTEHLRKKTIVDFCFQDNVVKMDCKWKSYALLFSDVYNFCHESVHISSIYFLLNKLL